MKIVYLGTGAAEGIPALFCNCEYCTEVKRTGGRMIRSRSQVLLDGELSIDFPPDAFLHAARGADLSGVKYLLVTHSHMDHFYAHDFILHGYKYAHAMTEPQLSIYCNEETAQVYDESVRREMREDVGRSVTVHTVRPFERFSFGGWAVCSLKAQHSSRDPLLFLLEKEGKRVLHLTDTGRLPEETYDYLASAGGRVDLVTLDCTFLDRPSESTRHMGLEENKLTMERLRSMGLADGDTRFVITHFSHNSRPADALLARAEREYGVIAAYDGMTLEI